MPPPPDFKFLSSNLQAAGQPHDLKQLVYSSLASLPMNPAELEELLHAARQKNRQKGITGLLVHHEGRFMQCLEGPHDAVDTVFRRISWDTRHRNVEVLLDQPTDGRSFASWDMACTEVGASAWLRLSTAQWVFNRMIAQGGTPGFKLLEQVWEEYRPR